MLRTRRGTIGAVIITGTRHGKILPRRYVNASQSYPFIAFPDSICCPYYVITGQNGPWQLPSAPLAAASVPFHRLRAGQGGVRLGFKTAGHQGVGQAQKDLVQAGVLRAVLGLLHGQGFTVQVHSLARGASGRAQLGARDEAQRRPGALRGGSGAVRIAQSQQSAGLAAHRLERGFMILPQGVGQQWDGGGQQRRRFAMLPRLPVRLGEVGGHGGSAAAPIPQELAAQSLGTLQRGYRLREAPHVRQRAAEVGQGGQDLGGLSPVEALREVERRPEGSLRLSVLSAPPQQLAVGLHQGAHLRRGLSVRGAHDRRRSRESRLRLWQVPLADQDRGQFAQRHGQ
mmetsp:Transcript_11189/g.28179  ORF Transcript_11189/g.28179 Transcript_11189/m.28179 type:complete len:342 (-) Transcript_11189:89-1114(-)